MKCYLRGNMDDRKKYFCALRAGLLENITEVMLLFSIDR
jgi:hypothetical protein